MVLNSGGGNKGKHVARKFIKQAAGGGNKAVRVAQDDGEMYAIVSKMFGNCMCGVTCYDGRTRLCIIRKKFTGRRKTDNTVASGSLVLVGVHAYGGNGVGNGGKGGKGAPVQRCDLLYVYNDQEREKLRKVCDISKLAAAVPGAPGASGSDASRASDDDAIKFVSSGTGIFNKYAGRDVRSGSAAVCGAGSQEQELAALETAVTINGAEWLKDMYPESESGSESGSESESESEPESESGPDQAQQPVQQPAQQPVQKERQLLPGRRPRADIISIDDI